VRRKDIEQVGNAASLLLGWSARYGGVLLGACVFLGVLVPPLARLFHPIIAPSIIGLMTLVLLRVDIPAAIAHLRRPGRLAVMVGFHALACPVIAWAVVEGLRLDAGIAAGVVIFATGCAATSGAAFARMVGLDPELSLIATLVTTILVPLTAPPMVYGLIGVDLAISLQAFAGRLGLVVGLPLLLSMALRRAIGAPRLAPHGPAVDGAVVWLVIIYGVGVMDGLAARLLADPWWVGQALAAAVVADFGLNLVTTVVLAPFGWRAAASAGMLSGNRNMALYLAVLPAAADPRLALFFALCQFPLFLSPFLLRPIYRWAGRFG
jgi:predicted Na+-dependent transporter